MGSYFHIFVMDADGSHVRQITQGDVVDLAPAWSQNRGIVFVRQDIGLSGYGSVWGVSMDGSTVEPITIGLEVGNFGLSPDGTRLAVHDAQTHQVVLLDVYGGRSETLINTDWGAPYLQPAWSRDGSALAVAGDGPDTSDECLLAEDGTNLQELPNGQASTNPAWKPGAPP